MLNSVYSKLGLASILILSLQLLFLIFEMQLMFNKAHLLTVFVYIIASTLAAASIFAFVVFMLFTRRLYSMTKAIEDFRHSNFSEPVFMKFSDANGDEISRLGFSIEQMQKIIITQIQLSQKIDTQRREIFANISHDLRTPLTSMSGYIETLLLKIGKIPVKQQRTYLEIALKQTVYLSKLINDLFELSKLESNSTNPKLEVFPLSELVQDVIQKFQLIAEEKSVAIKTNNRQSTFSTYADIGLIERVLTNLIENALRHCSSGATITIMLKQKDSRINVQVSDTGCGIAQDKLGHIFERQIQGNGIANDRAHTGAGLGLAITKRIIELHGGTIHADSQLGIGTNIHFDLPTGQYQGK
jgi:signal transduction histidine kinase